MPVTTRGRMKGSLFPDVWDIPGRTFFGPLFPDPAPSATDVTPTEPAGAATFVLDLEDGLAVTFEWQTDVFKAQAGSEQRREILDRPRRRFAGAALLIERLLATRAQLMRSAAQGQPFALGLPFEAMQLVADASGGSLTVSPTALSNCDWANPGQRVVVIGRDRTLVEGIIQGAAGSTIELDVSPSGETGKEGGWIAPIVAVYLAPQQGFERYRTPTGIERWKIDATAVAFGFSKSPVAASLDIEQSIPGKDNLVGIVLQARATGADGNAIRVSFQDDAISGVEIEEVSLDVTVRYIPTVTTVGELVAAINASSTLIKVVGAWNESFIVGDGGEDDTFALTNLTGGSDGELADDGVGATVAQHAGRPVFDRGIVNTGTNEEPMQAMNDLVDLGGVPGNVGQADTPDWARAIVLDGDLNEEWQWCKAFLSQVRGRQVTFWLASWRADLFEVSSGGSTITIQTNDFFTWYPRRRHVQLLHTDGTRAYFTIANAVDNGDGTTDIEIDDALSATPIEMISWLELARLEQDAVTVTFTAGRFTLATQARVVVQ